MGDGKTNKRKTWDKQQMTLAVNAVRAGNMGYMRAVKQFCGCLFSSNTHGEQWVQCKGCYRWAHEHCGATERMFMCPTCVKIQNKQRVS